MILLPIVDRELRVASRRRGTYVLRFFLVLVGSVLWFLLLTMLPSGLPMPRGEMVFVAVATLAFVFSLLSGVFLTSDSLSQEKREGTVGLLFLTELKGYDVVLGKLLATSVHAIYGLLAVFPLLALAMLIGGVTAGEFWRIALVLFVSLICSLSVGLLVSAICHDTWRAMNLALFTMLLLTFGVGPVGKFLFVLCGAGPGPFWPSPYNAYYSAFDVPFQTPRGPLAFWGALLSVVMISATSLYLACRLLPRRWSQGSESGKTPGGKLSRNRWVDSKDGYAARSPDLQCNPFFWLTTRDPMPQVLAWAILGALLALWSGLLAGSFSNNAGTSRFSFCTAMVVAFMIHQALKWLVASEASRRFSEDRLNGALELLLVTPLSVEQIIAGQRLALRKRFLGPTLLALAVNAALVWFLGWTNHPAISPGESVIYGELCVCGALLLLADLHALSWIGPRMAFQTRRHQRAIFATLARVLLLPWLVILFLGLLIMGGAGLSFELIRVLTVLWSGLAAVLVLSVGARAKAELVENFRPFSSGTVADVRPASEFEDSPSFAAPALQRAD